MSQEALAREAGLAQPTLSRLITGKTEGSRYIVQIANALGVAPEWLLSGADPQKSVVKATPSIANARSATQSDGDHEINIREMPRDVPILGSVRAGADEVFHLNGQVVDYARRPPRLASVRDSYALYVSGDSMAPWREEGQLVYVHPRLPVLVNDYVVVQMKAQADGHSSEAYVKRLVRRTEKEVVLLQYNPRKQLTVKSSEVAAVHKILDWSELMGL